MLLLSLLLLALKYRHRELIRRRRRGQFGGGGGAHNFSVLVDGIVEPLPSCLLVLLRRSHQRALEAELFSFRVVTVVGLYHAQHP